MIRPRNNVHDNSRPIRCNEYRQTTIHWVLTQKGSYWNICKYHHATFWFFHYSKHKSINLTSLCLLSLNAWYICVKSRTVYIFSKIYVILFQFGILPHHLINWMLPEWHPPIWNHATRLYLISIMAELINPMALLNVMELWGAVIILIFASNFQGTICLTMNSSPWWYLIILVLTWVIYICHWRRWNKMMCMQC